MFTTSSDQTSNSQIPVNALPKGHVVRFCKSSREFFVINFFHFESLPPRSVAMMPSSFVPLISPGSRSALNSGTADTQSVNHVAESNIQFVT
jgi:hypothetical protein